MEIDFRAFECSHKMPVEQKSSLNFWDNWVGVYCHVWETLRKVENVLHCTMWTLDNGQWHSPVAKKSLQLLKKGQNTIAIRGIVCIASGEYLIFEFETHKNISFQFSSRPSELGQIYNSCEIVRKVPPRSVERRKNTVQCTHCALLRVMWWIWSQKIWSWNRDWKDLIIKLFFSDSLISIVNRYKRCWQIISKNGLERTNTFLTAGSQERLVGKENLKFYPFPTFSFFSAGKVEKGGNAGVTRAGRGGS